MKFLKALNQKKLAKAVVCGLVVSGGMFVGMGQAFAETYISGAQQNSKKDWYGSSGTEVKITDTQPTSVSYETYSGGFIYGVYSESDKVNGGKVTINGGTVTGQIDGGYSKNETAEGNIVTINRGEVNKVSGAYSLNKNSNKNTVTVSGSKIMGYVYGGYAGQSGEAKGNIVNISGGTIDPLLDPLGIKANKAVYGGYSSKGTAEGNIVNISGGTINIPVIAGGGKDAGAINNTVNLIGIGGQLKVTEGYTKDGSAIENAVKGIEAINIGDGVYGSGQITYNRTTENYECTPAKTSSGNTLNVAGIGTNVGNIAGFQNINFYIQDSLTYGDTMVNITVDETTDISSAKVGVIVEAKPKDNGDDKTINLMTTNAGITWGNDYTITVKDGVKLIDGSKSIVELMNDNKDLVLTLAEINDDSAPSMVTPAATPLFEAMDKNKDSLSSNIKNFCKNLLDGASGSVEAKAANIQAAVSGAFQASEITGTTSTAVSVVNNVSNMTMSRMSLVDVGGGVSGGKGVGLMAPDSGADVWARYVHGKDKADGINMDGGSSDYSNNYNGFVVGADFKKVGKFQSGIAFSYVDGNGSNSFKDIMGATARYGHTDFHTYNFGYYGSVKNDDTNTMFDLSYGTTSSDSDTNGVGGAQSFSSKSKIFNAGVTAEKSFDVSGMKLVPYTGLRYMHVDGGEYTDSLGINHNADKQNVFMLPVGLKLSKENKLSHDWTLTPKLDLSYTWNMGDTDSEMTVSVPGLTSSRLGYSVMDTGSFMGVAGVEAQRKNWTYGVSYAYQKGSHQDSKKIIADIKMSF